MQKREEIYEDLLTQLKHQGVKTLSFKTTLLRALASEIVVKEHRHRYQTEQHQRFVRSLKYLGSDNITLDDFCKDYAHFIQ